MTDTALTPETAHPWHVTSPPSIREVVTERVRRAILVQEIRPGTRVRQTQLAEALGVSRMPVRDAIQELVAEGLLHALPHGGVTVPPFDVDEILDALTLRGPLEAEAVRAVAARAPGEGELAALHEVGTGLDFHRALCDLAGNRFLVTALGPIWAQAQRAHLAPGAGATCRPDSPAHVAVVAALAAGDADVATQALTGHLAAVCDEVAGWSAPPEPARQAS